MRIVLSALIGYLLGCISPAALIARAKHKDIRKSGTGNLGATNVMLNFGTRFGFLVMGVDMMKAVCGFYLAKWLFPELELAGLIGGSFAVVGHIFPFYMHFKGGKGLAPLGGLVLAYSPFMFLTLLLVCGVLTLIFDHGVVMSYSASILFSLWAGFRSGDVAVFGITAMVACMVMWKHAENIRWAREDTDNSVREYLFRRRSKTDGED